MRGGANWGGVNGLIRATEGEAAAPPLPNHQTLSHHEKSKIIRKKSKKYQEEIVNKSPPMYIIRHGGREGVRSDNHRTLFKPFS